MKNLVKLLALSAVVLLTTLSLTACPDGGGGGTHTHTYSAAWSSDATQHWRECTANDGAKTDTANHTGDPCTVCGYASNGDQGVAPTITTTSLPNGEVGIAYSQTLAATGDTPITWSRQSGSLPNGLTLNTTTGAITGTPTVAYTFNFTVKATNAKGDGTQSLSITIAPSGAPTITTTSLPNGLWGTAYNQTLAATGDTPITWSIQSDIQSDSLPGGLTLNASTGVITGNPTTAGTSSFTVRATNAKGNGTRRFSITITHTPHTPNTETGLCTACNALTYNLGDTGPGGGKIYYRLEAGFTQYANATDTTGTTAHYLEAAPADMSGTLAWASSGFTSTDISGTETAIGTGRKNTALILATDVNAPAAKACKDYSNGGKTDWFLPSLNELRQLYVNRASVGNMGTDGYMSSSQYTSNFPCVLYFNTGDTGIGNYKYTPRTVRAVRAF